MIGRNLFSRGSSSVHKSHSAPGTCVFISHQSADKPTARIVAEALRQSGVDIYFDEEDVCVRGATGDSRDEKVAHCIEQGLDDCSHLLGVITKNTVRSWWVPYEIGGAKGREKGMAHLVHRNVTALPGYIKVCPVLLFDQEDLKKWARRLGAQQFMEKSAGGVWRELGEVLPEYRTGSAIRWES